MANEYYQLSWWDLLISLVFILMTIGMIRFWRLNLGGSLVIGTIRSFAQLTFMGYALTFIFNQQHWAFMTGLLLLMILVASYEAYRRQQKRIPKFFPMVLGSLTLTAIIILGTALHFILDVKPWYNPYVAIPIAGMMLGNAMNSVSLTANRFVAEMEHREKEIETLLSLGATPKQAALDALRESIRASLIPSINTLMTVGLVQLPGMMTGQILAGVSPALAVRYQIMIMYMWVTTATMVNTFTLTLIYRRYFTARMQLRRELLH